MMKKSSGRNGGGRNGLRLFCLLAVSFSFWLFLFSSTATCPLPRAADPCTNRYVYIHGLPPRFNSDMLRDCRDLSPWTDMCRFVANSGLGPKLDNPDGVFSDNGWYATNQFALEVIFHRRMERYDCLTNDSSLASAVYVPFYAGLDIGRHLWEYNVSVRDSAATELAGWLRSRPEWTRLGGRDHFTVSGRITWDFRRLTDEDTDWGSKLLFLPEVRNMTVLVIESSPWHNNDFAVPYPTYFHPSRVSEILSWQDRMRGLNRNWLFSFAGAPRPNQTESIRSRMMGQCKSSRRCRLLECDFGASKCHSPSSVMGMFQESVFCLQPQGDSYTRRSAFDSMLAGCIPVFFHPGSAYVQYTWHLPRNYTEYSVFISEDKVREGKVTVEQVLSRFSDEEVSRMREKVIGMIPGLIYVDPREAVEGVRDAFDVAVDGVIKRVEKIRREGIPSEIQEESSWKYEFVGSEGKHEWDHFFYKPRS